VFCDGKQGAIFEDDVIKRNVSLLNTTICVWNVLDCHYFIEISEQNISSY
jgi:hypothetical protein